MAKPRSTAELLQQGLAHHQSGRPAEAARLYAQVLAREPGQPAANHLLGLLRLQSGAPQEAVELISRAVRANPGEAQYHANLGVALNAAARPAEALAALDRALSRRPAFPEALSNRGMALKRLGRPAEAAASYRQAIALRPNEAGFHFNLANTLLDYGDWLAAEAAYRRALQLRPLYPAATAGLAAVLDYLGRSAEAADLLQRALRDQPQNPELHYRLGRTLYQQGQLPAAAESYRRAIALRPTYGDAQHQLAQMLDRASRPDDVAALEALLARPDLAPDDRIYLGFALGRSLTDLGAHDAAIAAYDQANALRRQTEAAPVEAALAELATLPDRYPAAADPGYPDYAPIFIVGLPRSGKSTLERLLATRPGLHPAGELRFLGQLAAELGAAGSFRELGAAYAARARAIAPPGATVIDTMPANFRHVGLIRLALPRARVIHCTRSPAAHRVALYEKHFAAAGYEYSCTTHDIIRYHDAYSRLMSAWHARYPGFVLDLDLANLAASGMADLQRFCDLPPFGHDSAPAESEPRLDALPPAAAAQRQAAHLAAYRRHHPELLQ